jgi:hypothetical protein
MQFLWFFEHLRYNDLIYKLLYWEYGLPSTDIALSIERNAMAEVAVPADHAGDLSLDIRWLSG